MQWINEKYAHLDAPSLDKIGDYFEKKNVTDMHYII